MPVTGRRVGAESEDAPGQAVQFAERAGGLARCVGVLPGELPQCDGRADEHLGRLAAAGGGGEEEVEILLRREVRAAVLAVAVGDLAVGVLGEAELRRPLGVGVVGEAEPGGASASVSEGRGRPPPPGPSAPDSVSKPNASSGSDSWSRCG